MTINLDTFNLDFDEDEPDPPEYEAALEYYKRGWNVVPLVHGKKFPAVKYRDWIVGRQTLRNVTWMRNIYMNGGGVAAITGAVSGIVVIDTDGLEGEAVISDFEALHGPLPETLIHRSGSGRGLHRFFVHPRDGRKIVTRANPSIKFDVKGDGGIVVLPPTKHASGELYRVEHDAPIALLTEGLIEFSEERAAAAEGRAVRPAARADAGGSSALGDNLSRRVPLNVRNILIVKSALNALPDEYAIDEKKWFVIGCALRSFDSGDMGLKLFERFSNRCPAKATETNFKEKWAYLGRPYRGRPITVETLRYLAIEHGWSAVPWDWSGEQ